MRIVYARSSNIFDDSRATKELIALLDVGHLIHVLGWNRSGNAYEQCKEVFAGYSKQIEFHFYSGGIGVNVLSKIYCRYKWGRWIKNTISRIDRVDIVHACDFDTGNEIRHYCNKHNIRYIYDIFDYYVDAHPVPSFIRKYVEQQEIKTINDSEICIICTDERREQIKGSNPKRVLVIHNSPDVMQYQPEEAKYDYVYCGSMFGGRLIGEILESYNEHNNYRFVFAGYGSFSEYAEQLDSEYTGFTYLGAVPYSKVLEIEKKTKIISAIYDPSIRNHQLCAPNKFYEALALGKPLIVCRGTGIDKVVVKYGLGEVIDYDVKQFYEALDTLLSDTERCIAISRRARCLFEEEYQWNKMKEKLIITYNNLEKCK